MATRFQAKRAGPDGALVKDNLTGRTVATFPADPDHKGMALKFAQVAAEAFNQKNWEYLELKKKRNW